MLEKDTRIMLPIGPISEWISKQDIKSLSRITGVNDRYLRKLRDRKNWDGKNKQWKEYKNISTDMVEKIILPMGVILRELYPDF